MHLTDELLFTLHVHLSVALPGIREGGRRGQRDCIHAAVREDHGPL